MISVPGINNYYSLYNNIQTIEMESTYANLLQDLDSREKHILQLESELLRLDYEYGLIIKDLKQKYAQISQEYTLNHYTLKQLKKQNKRLQAAVARKQKELQHTKLQVEDYCMKSQYQEEALKRAREENEVLKNQIKFMEGNQNKQRVKAQQASRKKDQYKAEVLKLEEKVGQLQKQVKKSHIKRKELEELVEQEVLDTQQRIQNIGIQYFTKNNLNQTQKRVVQNMDSTLVMKKTLHNDSGSNPEDRQKQLINDWQSDMKKLKNCMDYGNSYMLMFDPMNFDRAISREIFKFLRKTLKQIDDLNAELKQLQSTHNNSLASHKLILQRFQEQLENISREKNNKVTIDSQIQTDNPSSFEAQKALYQLSELNMKLKIKNTGLVGCLEMMGLRNAAVFHLLENAHTSNRYWRAAYYREGRETKTQLRPISKFRIVGCSILFVQLLWKKQKTNKQVSKKVSTRVQCRDQKIRRLCEVFQKECPQNIQLQKLKDSVVIDHQSVYERCSEVVEYYQFKLKNWVQKQSTCLPNRV